MLLSTRFDKSSNNQEEGIVHLEREQESAAVEQSPHRAILFGRCYSAVTKTSRFFNSIIGKCSTSCWSPRQREHLPVVSLDKKTHQAQIVFNASGAQRGVLSLDCVEVDDNLYLEMQFSFDSVGNQWAPRSVGESILWIDEIKNPLSSPV